MRWDFSHKRHKNTKGVQLAIASSKAQSCQLSVVSLRTALPQVRREMGEMTQERISLLVVRAGGFPWL